ncbi:MAG: sulfite exporter TauE/SafE family protein [Gammaproteobacteria bacterium]|nr:sulfite exporter TauE/SafE family protein [Gammaproteobacteria bacterium]
MDEWVYFAAFIMGFFGGTHCVGMCGGIVGALSFGLAEEKRDDWWASFPYILVYNLGRMSSYALAGAIVGGISLLALDLTSIDQLKQGLKLLAGGFMLVLGLYLGGWWHGLLRVEQMGQGLWKHLQPIGQRFMPVRTLRQALILGMVWGWLPCGLVYSALILALTATSIEQGALIMLSFGLGTLPTVMAMGLLASLFTSIVRQPWVRKLSGAMVFLFGLYMLWQVYSGEGWLG